MPKVKSAYVCAECGGVSVKWAGQCPECAAWNSLASRSVTSGSSAAAAAWRRLGDLADELGEALDRRYRTGFGEFDRVLGGGVVPGAVILLGGDPGVGKSTLLQQISACLPGDLKACYATGEESLRQIGQRGQRLGLGEASVAMLAETSLDSVLSTAEDLGSRVLVIDSMQTMLVEDLGAAAGSVPQLREAVARIVRFAKQRDVAVFVIGHVTKEGAIAGPRVVEHMVDTVLYFENDPSSRYTLIRAVKNRFGATGEMGVFAMTAEGFREVRNPSAIFLSRETGAQAGSVVSVAWEGSRPLLVEIQALVADSGGSPRRLAQGMEQTRLALLLAILARHGGIEIANEDVFVNVVGGLRINETAVDLPGTVAIVSSFRDAAVDARTMCFGELGLAGEVRPVRFGEQRIAAAAKQGFTRCIVPQGNRPRQTPKGMSVIGVKRLCDALECIRS